MLKSAKRRCDPGVMKLPSSAGPSGLDTLQPIPCTVEYIAPGDLLSHYLQAHLGTVLGVVHFSGTRPPSGEVPDIVIPLVQVGNVCQTEVWASRLALSYGRSGHLSYAKNDQILFLTYTLDAEGTRNAPLDTLIDAAYDELLQFLHAQAYPHLLRLWNFFPAINADEQQLERYRRFSIGRQAAFARHGYVPPANIPAASAIGTGQSGLWIYGLAARTSATTLENPRQISAYHYPPRYGPRSPWFSRAVLKDWGAEWHLYISGTASIVGHKSCNIGDPEVQLEEICRNLRTLLETAAVQHGLDLAALSPASVWKVYVRSPQPALIAERLAAIGGLCLPTVILEADLCRAELLIEVEGVLRFAK
jgi:chorismate lyase / 3-hydroxybenzoate synthase